MTDQNEQVEVEETTPVETVESSSPQSEETSSKELEFEEPDFAAITDFVDGHGEGEPPVAAQTEEEETPVEETPPEELPVEAESESETPAVEEEAEPEPVETKPEEKEETPKVEEPEPVKLPTQEELEGMYAEHREKTLPVLEEKFVLTEEEAAALDEQPSKIIPKLAGQMMYDTMLSTYNAVLAALPTVVGAQLVAAKKAESAQSAFFDAWPDLNNEKGRPAVAAAVHAYRAANPRADLKTVIKQAGVMAMLNLGLDPSPKPQAQPKPKAKAKPARPASPGHTTQQTPPVQGQQDENIFSQLAELIDQDMN